MFYLANDDRPDRARRFCWDCGNDDTPRTADRCVSCGANIDTRTFLVSVRWDRDGFQAYADYFERSIDHPGFAAPVDMFFQDDVLCSVTLWHGEGLLLDEASPLPVQQVLDMGQRATGILAYLHHHGVTLRNLGATNFLIQEGERVVLYDPDIREVYEDKVPDDERSSDVALLGQLLRRFVPVEAIALTDVLGKCADGEFETPFAFGRALEELIRANLPEPSPIAAGMTDVGLARTSTGARVFGAMKGAVDGGVAIPHSEHRFPGADDETKELDAEVHRNYIFATHVGEYMEYLEEEDPELFKEQFSGYIKAGLTADNLEEKLTECHKQIRADCARPTKTDAERKAFHGKHAIKGKRGKMSRQQRVDRVKQKLAAWSKKLAADEE
jgi:hypothetical protein